MYFQDNYVRNNRKIKYIFGYHNFGGLGRFNSGKGLIFDVHVMEHGGLFERQGLQERGDSTEN